MGPDRSGWAGRGGYGIGCARMGLGGTGADWIGQYRLIK